MVAISFLLALSTILAASARPLPYRMPAHLLRRQATLVASTDATDFGKCSVPQIKGALGIDGRKEFSFEPVDKVSFAQGSAQNIGIITAAICNLNACDANAAARTLCESAEAAVGAGKDDGALADKFNAFFGITTNFAAAVGSVSAGGAAVVAAPVAAPVAAAEGAADGAAAAAPVAAVSAGAVDFGKCSPPQIKGGVGIDGRKEFSFSAVDGGGSAQNIAIITQRLCNLNGCDANAAARTLCESAEAAVGAGKDDGALADKFNAFFGITTNFASAVGSVSAAGAGNVAVVAAPTTAAAVAATATASAVAGVVTVTVTAPCAAATAVATAAPAPVVAVENGSVDLGSCSDPTIVFKNGLPGRQEPAFIAANLKDFNQGSALNIAVITNFIQQRFNSPCNAGADAIAAGIAGAAAAQAAGGKTGAAADAWNAAFGISTNFAAGATRA